MRDEANAILRIGSYGATTEGFNGTIDEVAVWNISLSADTIAEHAGIKVLDSSQYGNNGTRQPAAVQGNATNFTDAKFGKGLVFDGIDDYVNVSHSNSLNIAGTEISLEAWFKLDSIDGAEQPRIIAKGNNAIWNLFIYPTTRELSLGIRGDDTKCLLQ